MQIKQCLKQKGAIFSKISKPVHVPQEQHLSFTESVVNIVKLWNALNRLLIIWKSGLSDKIKQNIIEAVALSILLARCTRYALTKCMEKKLDWNYTRMLHAVLSKSWKQHFRKQQLPILQIIEVKQTCTHVHTHTHTHRVIFTIFYSLLTQPLICHFLVIE